MITLKQRINNLVKQHGGVRPAARFIGIDPAYLVRLRDGVKTVPGKVVLQKLKLRKIVFYERTYRV